MNENAFKEHLATVVNPPREDVKANELSIEYLAVHGRTKKLSVSPSGDAA